MNEFDVSKKADAKQTGQPQKVASLTHWSFPRSHHMWHLHAGGRQNSIGFQPCGCHRVGPLGWWAPSCLNTPKVKNMGLIIKRFSTIPRLPPFSRFLLGQCQRDSTSVHQYSSNKSNEYVFEFVFLVFKKHARWVVSGLLVNHETWNQSDSSFAQQASYINGCFRK